MGVKIKNFFDKYKFILAGLFLFFSVLIIVLFPSFSEKTSTSLWDGSVADKFSKGSGIKDDPYIIEDGAELAYFFTLINGDDYKEYYNRYYELNNNIDLNNISFNYTASGKSFNGYLDGNGYTIKNLLIDTPYIDENGNENYTLFDELNGCTIKNINFVNSNIYIKSNEYVIEIDEEIDDSKENIEPKGKNEELKVTDEVKDEVITEAESKKNTEISTEKEKNAITEEEKSIESSLEISNPEETSPNESEVSEEIEDLKETNDAKKETTTEIKSEEATKLSAEKEILSEEETENSKENDETKEEITTEQENINVKKETVYKNVTVSLLSNNVELSTISNININNVNLESENNNENIKTSLFILNDIDNNKISNININGNSSLDNTSILIENYNSAKISLVLYSNDNLKLINNSDEEFETVYRYSLKNNKISFNDNYPIKSILELLNNNSELTWAYNNGEFRIVNNGSDPKRPLMKMMSFRSTPTAHASGLDASTHTVYINDYESDKNYYGGLNYTYSSASTIPTLNNKNIYGNNNLVYVQLNYHGTDINNENTGYVSLAEQYSDFVYYKVYEVVDGYVTIDLIDNPYGDRPNDKVFYGWITDYAGATITLDMDVYIRRVKIPVTMNGSTPNNINIDLYALWGAANTVMANTTSWDEIMSNGILKDHGYYSILVPYNAYLENMTYYYIRTSIRRNVEYPSGSVNSSGNALTGLCNATTCSFYVHPTDSQYDSSVTYYSFTNGAMNTYYPTPTQLYRPPMPLGTTASGLFKSVNIPRYASLNGYYNNNGQLQTGNCNTYGGCNCYELIQYYGVDNEMELVEDGTDYFYFATRDTNIIVLNQDRSNINPDIWNSQYKPFTVTSLNNGTNYAGTNNATWRIRNSTLNCWRDTKIEYVRVYADATKQNNDSGPGTGGAFVGNYYNTKIGRGLIFYGNNTSFSNAGGGNNNATGSAGNLTKYTFVVESGEYNNLSVTSPSSSANYNSVYIKGYATYGSDFDRVSNVNNKLDIRYCASGSWTGNIYAADGKDVAMYTNIKSGQFGTNKYDYAAGVYVGGRSYGGNYSARSGLIEGGYIYNLLGGPLSQESNKGYNDTYINVKGGNIDVIVGGAGRSTTYGNRIIQVTGGQINYSVFGGSNGVSGDNSEGTLDGDTYLYIGGNAVIGNESYVNSNSVERGSQVEAGSVFGIGNGKAGSTSIGTVNNSYVVVDGNATIRRNVYGGGNYGAAGQSGTNKTYQTKIDIHDGAIINGSVYGGGNNNGSGSTSNIDNITITMDGGTVNGSIYGGSRTLGRVYGSTNISITGGTINTDVYGGGEGGYANANNYGTFVRDNVSVTIGNSSGGPTINGNVYGGSAYGTVNATDIGAESNEKSVEVVVNNGNVIGSVFGGAKGSSTYTPYVKGIINVNINGGTITNVYGGFDEEGSPEPIELVYEEAEDIGDIDEEDDPTTPSNSDFIYISGMKRSSGASTTDDSFDKNSISSTVTLPNQNSTVTYKVNVTNISNKNWGIHSITGLNSNLEYEISNYNLKDILCNGSETQSVYITIKYKNGGYVSSNTTYDLNLDFNFKKVYNITYENFYTANHYPSDIITNNYYDNNGNTININNIQYPKYIMEDDSVSFDFFLNIPNRINVSSTATSSYTKPHLTISNPTGNVLVSNLTTGDIVMYDHPSSVTFNGYNNINTKVPLLSNANRYRDFRVEFTIDSRNNNNENLGTIFNVMDEGGSPWPGIVFRVDNGQYRIEANGGSNGNPQNFPFNNVNSVIIEKIGGNVTVRTNNGNPITISNYNGFGYAFDIPATFGSSMQNINTVWRYFRGSLSKMKITYLDNGTTFNPSTQPTPDVPEDVEPDNSRLIYISGIERSGGASTNDDSFDSKSIFSTVTLPNQSSTVTYKIDITNATTKNWGIYRITGLDSNLEYQISDYNMKDILCNGYGTKSIYLTVKYKNGRFDSSNTTYDLNLSFFFRKVYSIIYENFYTANHYPSDVITNNYYDNNGNLININNIEYPKQIMERDSVSFDFYLNIPNRINVSSTATSTYTKPNLTISDPIGNVLVSNLTTGDIVMYDHPSSVTFNGNNNINTGIQLLSSTNRNRDFQVEFTVNSRGQNDNNATLFSVMDESGSPWPGVMLRIENNQYHTEANGGSNGTNQNFGFNNIDSFVIKKQNGNVTIKANGGNELRLSSYAGFGYSFNIPVTFGSSMQNINTVWRYFRGTMSKMKVTYLDNGVTFTPSAQPSPDTPDIPINPDDPGIIEDPDDPDFPDIPGNPMVPRNTPGNVHVYLNGGTITNAFGGGNNTSIDVTDINLQGSTVTNLYGGSNNSGDVAIANVNVTSGTVDKVFGGNNVGGTCTKTNVDVSGGTITNVYGGGNEVFTTATYVTISDSDEAIPSVYGGGNNVGNRDNSPGVTKTNVIVKSNAEIIDLYGGSNDNGYVELSNIKISNGTITNVYGGGNNADANQINLDINSGTIEGNVYGGGNNANVNNVDIDIKNGTINTLYGGGNNGNVLYGITIDMSDGTITDDIYGGGNNGSVTKTIALTTTGGTIEGSVYGGGKGSTATVGRNINVTMSETSVEEDIFGGGNAGAALSSTNVDITSCEVDGTVYGGGNAADVNGVINVNISSSNINGHVFGGGNEGESHSSVNVTIDESSNIKHTVYGGGNAADVDGAITVNIISSSVESDVIGGGNEGESHSIVNVNISDSSEIAGSVYGGGNAADVDGAIGVNISSSTVQTDVFGGGNEGASQSVVTVNITNSSEINGNVYGGGNAANVRNPINVNINSSEINGNVFGGGNEGASLSTVRVNIADSSDIIGTVYGGGNAANVFGSIVVNISSSTLHNDVYGGGNNGNAIDTTTVITNENTLVTGDIYGGGNNGTVEADSTATINGGTVNGSVYGGGKGSTATVYGDAVVNINSGLVKTNVFGGGNNGIIDGNTDVNSTGGTIQGALYGGGNNASVNGNTSVELQSTIISGNIYGGGNNGIVNGSTDIVIKDVTANGSIYGGGNLATVKGDTNISVGGTSVVGTSTCNKATDCSVFGGGNKAEVGTSAANDSIATVNIVGGTVYGNVYGGCNTSRVYGQTVVNVGDDVEVTDLLIKDNVLINGTIFGGGEANASGSEEYDYSYISVTNAITININGNDYTNFDLNGSIFGSGNASTSGGTSEINIKNYGTYSNPKRNVSIQRTGLLTIDNSAIVLEGAKDRTNRFSDYLFSLSIIDELQLKNNSTLYLETGANLLKSFKSLTANGQKETVEINDDNKTVTKNVDNRVYMLAGAQTNPLNIATNQDATTYGDVYGMTFFGMYTYGNNDSINVGMYGKYDYDEQYQGGIINGGAYVLGGHKTNHDIEVDGFYSNIVDELTSLNTVYYIEPTPADSNFYRWIIGEDIKEINVDLKASKYSTLSTKEVMFTDYTDPNTTFEIIGFDYSELADGISLVDRNDIPRIAANGEDADSIMALSMEAADTGWLTTGSTYFLTDQTNPITGTTAYVGENTSAAPSMILYIHHSKNISTSGDMGKVSVVLRITTKIDELTSKFERLVVNINLTRDFITTDDYEGAITGGRKYSLFASTATNITSKSSFSAYYSLFKEGTSIYKTGDHRALVSSFAFPQNTKITMIDVSGNKYYYHVITAAEEQSAANELLTQGDIHYNLSMFEEMGAQNSGVYYNDAQKNIDYYNVESQAADEEFIFIVDFEDTNISQTKLENSILLEMLDVNDETKISVVGEQHQKMVYNIYTGLDANLDLNGTIDKETIYNGGSFLVDVLSEYTQSVSSGGTVVDTQYLDSKLGMIVSLYNSNNELVSGASLLGLTYTMDGVDYSPNIDGTTRIKLADKVGNIEKWLRINTGTSNLATGDYKLVIENFASPDGIYYGLNTADTLEFDIKIINEIYGLNVETEDEMVVIYGNEGYNLNGNERLVYTINYNSGLENPEIHLKMYRRMYNEVYDTEFELVDLQDYVSNPLFITDTECEYLVVDNPGATNTLALFTKQHLLNGTYKMEFILYDGDSPIGSVDKYIIIK